MAIHYELEERNFGLSWTKGKKKMEAKKVTVTKMQILLRCEKKLGIPAWNAEDYSVGMKIKLFSDQSFGVTSRKRGWTCKIGRLYVCAPI